MNLIMKDAEILLENTAERIIRVINICFKK